MRGLATFATDQDGACIGGLPVCVLGQLYIEAVPAGKRPKKNPARACRVGGVAESRSETLDYQCLQVQGLVHLPDAVHWAM